jgi:hypothetical protein
MVAAAGWHILPQAYVASVPSAAVSRIGVKLFDAVYVCASFEVVAICLVRGWGGAGRFSHLLAETVPLQRPAHAGR